MQWTTNKLGFDSQYWQEIYLFSKASRLTVGLIQPHIQWVPAVLWLEVKQAMHEADLSRQSTVKFRSELKYTYTRPNTFIACMGTLSLYIEQKFIKHTADKQCSCTCIVYTWRRRAPDILFKNSSNSWSNIWWTNISLQVYVWCDCQQVYIYT